MKALWVTDRDAPGGSRIEEIFSALRGAPGLAVEIRERKATDREVLALVRTARERLGPDVPVSVNRRFDLALAAGAAGVHLPADGLPPARVRANTPRGFRVGVSTHSAAEAQAAIEKEVDVVVIGPVFATPSKAAWGEPLGVGELERLPPLASHGSEVFAIGGISEERIEELDPVLDRLSGIAAVRLFQAAPDPRALFERIAFR
ncbi:MAG TPA: thiamine phosphate synthase [Thermoanaerobaculia bacterium]|nr:thiamine phosphate synthase [Thermoanaerobaculia bacterium]